MQDAAFDGDQPDEIVITQSQPPLLNSSSQKQLEANFPPYQTTQQINMTAIQIQWSLCPLLGFDSFCIRMAIIWTIVIVISLLCFGCYSVRMMQLFQDVI